MFNSELFKIYTRLPGQQITVRVTLFLCSFSMGTSAEWLMPTVDRPFTATIISPHLETDRQTQTGTETDCHDFCSIKTITFGIYSAWKSQFHLTINCQWLRCIIYSEKCLVWSFKPVLVFHGPSRTPLRHPLLWLVGDFKGTKATFI